LIANRRLAVDAGTGDGALLEVLAPLFERVIAVDRSSAQLALAKERAKKRGFDNITFIVSEIEGRETHDAVRAELASASKSKDVGADVVFASRVLHHAVAPARALRSLVELARPPKGELVGGAVFVLDYALHEDLDLRDSQADLWLGFAEDDLSRLAREAGLEAVTTRLLPPTFRGDGPDRHLDWIALSGTRGHRVVT
ncbi:MAG: methyltransferase domain-containing protein, partial [Polyangiaceae bacterium]